MCRLFLMTVALMAIIFGLSGLYMMPRLVQQKIEQKIQLKIGTKTWDRFTRVPIPLTVKFHLFNISNAEQVLAGLERPQFQEVGPFVFKQWRRRDVMDIVDNNRKITYREYKTFYALWPFTAPTNNNYAQISQDQPTWIDDDGAHDLRRVKYLDLDQAGQPIVPSPHAIDVLDSHFMPPTTSAASSSSSSSSAFILNPYMHNITLVNLPLLTVLNQLAKLDEGSLKRNVAAKVLARLIKEGKEKILITKPVNELLFDGYKVGLMEAASDLISNTLGYNFDSPLPRNKFGFFYGKNNTWSRKEAGEMTVFTGRNESMRDFMLVDNWNGQRTLNVWPRNTEAGNRCNEVRGTDGSQFHPGVTRDQVLDIFSPMICTSIFIKYREDTSARDIPLLRFTTPPDVFAAPKKNSRNACYCTIKPTDNTGGGHSNHYQPADHSSVRQLMGAGSHHHHRHQVEPQTTTTTTTTAESGGALKTHKARITDGRCYIDGLMDLSLCQKGAPIAASGPHFYNADPMLAMAAGLKPQKHLHETYLDIEPMTGSVFRAASRAQLNALVEQAALEVVDASLIGNMTAMVAPLLWLEESAAIDEKSSLEFKGQLLNVVQKGRRSFYYAIVFGSLLALIVTVQYWYVTCYKIDMKKSSGGNKRTSRRAARRNKQQLLDEEQRADEMRQAKGPAGRRHRKPSRSRSGSGTRRARNLAATPLVAGALGPHQSEKDVGTSLAGPLLVAAGLAGAADAAATNNQRRREREWRRSSRRPADYAANGDDNDDDDDEERLSKRGLVDNEWSPANQSSASTGDHSSPVASTSGGDQHQREDPDGSDGEPEDQRRVISETDFD